MTVALSKIGLMAVPRIYPSHTAVLVVDVQEKLLPHMHNREALLPQVVKLLDGARVLSVPVFVTEQYPGGLGRTVPQVFERLDPGVGRHEKLKFSACIEPVREELVKHGVRSVLVCGLEAHVCVLQTCLDLADSGYIAAVVTDAVGSRRESDQAAAVQRMVQAGVLPTTVEAALLELAHEAGGTCFRDLLRVIR